MVVEPIKNRDGTVKTNVQIIREGYNILKRLKEGVPGQTDEQRTREYQEYTRITNGEEKIFDFFKSVAEIEDDTAAQKYIERNLMPIDGIRPELRAPMPTKHERIHGIKGGK